MKIVAEINLYDFEAWSGGRDTLNTLTDKLGKDELDALECQIVECLGEEITDSTLNDFLWFDTDTIANMLGFSSWEKFIKEDEEEDLDDKDEDEEDI